jgi:molecular chaperone DnaK
MREAESHAAEDKRRKEEVETRNQADQAVYGVEKMLREMGDKVAAADRAGIEAAVNDVKSALEKNDAAAIKGALERLTAAQHKLAESLYQQAGHAGSPGAGSGPGAGAAPGGGAPKDDVIDAEVVDDGKK